MGLKAIEMDIESQDAPNVDVEAKGTTRTKARVSNRTIGYAIVVDRGEGRLTKEI